MIRVVRLRRFEKNTLRGFVSLELSRVGLILHDCTWHVHDNGREWIGFPAKQYETKDGTTAWQPLIEFASGADEARRQFQEQAVAAVHAFADEQDEAV